MLLKKKYITTHYSGVYMSPSRHTFKLGMHSYFDN